MHILSVGEPIKLLAPGDTIGAGSYYLEDQNAAQLLVFAESGVMQPHPDELAHISAPLGESVLFFRAGGFGDLMFLTPVLRRHKQLYPNAKIGVSCFPPYAAVLEGLEYVDQIVPYPTPMAVAESYPRWVLLEGAVERDARARTMHMTDLFAEIAAVDFEDDTPMNRRIDYRVRVSESIWSLGKFPQAKGRKRVGIQVRASARSRSYPLGGISHIAKKLIEKGCDVYLLGQRGDLPPQKKKIPHLFDLTAEGLTFRDTCAVVNSCAAVVAPDSALLHVAGALGVPAVGLYGPFPREIRTKYAPTTFAIEGKGPCSPCFHHTNQARQDHFPEQCPSKDVGICAVLGGIDADRAIAKVMQIAREIPE